MVEKFEEGKWYKYTSSKTGPIEELNVWSDGKPRKCLKKYRGSYSFENIQGNWGYDATVHRKNFIEVPDPTKETKFNVGDRVVKARPYSEGTYCKYGGTERGVPIGTEGSFIKIRDLDKVIVNFDNGKRWSVSPTELDLVRTLSESASVIEAGKIKNVLGVNMFVSKEEMNMELKDIKKENLKEAKKQVAAERANAEILEAKRQLRQAQDEINRLDREKKQFLEEDKLAREEPNKVLASFK